MENYKEFSLKLEYAVLEQSVNKANLLFQDIVEEDNDQGNVI
jgi:hypothetical protein